MKGAKAKQAGLRLFSRLVAAPAPGREQPASTAAGGALGGIAATLARSQSLGLFQETSPPRGFVVQPLAMPAGTEAFASVNGAAAELALTPDTKTHWSSTHMASVLGVKLPSTAPMVAAGIRLLFGCEAKPDAEVKPGALEATLPERMNVQVRLAPSKEGGSPSSWVSVVNAQCVGASDDSDAKSAATSDSDSDADDGGGDKAGEPSSAQQEQSSEAGAAASSAALLPAATASSAPDAAARSSVAAACVKATFKAPAEPLAPVDLVFHQPLRVVAVRIRMRGRFPLPEAASGPFGASSVKQEHTVVRFQLLELPDERTAPSALSSLGAVRTWLGNAAAAAMAADPSLGTAAAAIQALTDLARASGSLVDLLAVSRALHAAGDAALPPAVASSVAKLVAAVEATREAANARVSAEELSGRRLTGSAGGAPTWGPLQAKWAKGKGYSTSSLTLSDGDTVVRSQSSPTVQVATAGPFKSGRAEWTFLLVEDSTSQCSCFGLATLPITDGNYSGSSQLWMYRAFNGQRYNLGDSSSAPSELGEAAKVQKGQTIRFVLDFEKGSSGEVRAFVQGKDVGVAFTGIRGKSVFPAVQFYSSGREVRIVSVKGPHSAGVPIGEGEAVDDGGASEAQSGGSASAEAALRQATHAGRLELVRVAGRQGASSRSGDAPGLGAAAGDATTGDGFLPQQDVRAALRSFAGAIFEGTDGLPEVSAKDLALAKKLEGEEEQEEPGEGGDADSEAGESKHEEGQAGEAARAGAASGGLHAEPFPESPLRLDQATPALAFAGGHAIMAQADPAVPLWGAVGVGGRAPEKPEGASQTAVAAAGSAGPELVVAGPDSKALKIARSLALVCPSEAEVASTHGPPPVGGADQEEAEAEAVAAVLEASGCSADGAAAALAARRAAAWGPGARAFAYWTAALDGKYMHFSAQCAVHSKVLKRVEATAADEDAATSTAAGEDEVASLSSVRIAFELLGDGRVLHRVESAQAAPGELLSAELSASVLGVRRLTVRAWCGSAEHNRVCAVLVNPTALPCTDWICGGWRNDRRSLVCRVHGVRRGEPLPAAPAAVGSEAGTARSAAASLLDAAGRLAREYAREMRHFGAAHVPDPLPSGAHAVSAWPLESPYAVDTSPAALLAAAATLGRARTAAEATTAAGAGAAMAHGSPAQVARAADLAMACVRRLAVSRVALDEADAVAHASGLAARAAGKAAAEQALVSVRAELQAVADSASLAETEAGRAAVEALAALSAFHGGADATPAWEAAVRSAGSGGAVLEVELPWPSCVRGAASASTMAFGGALDGFAAAASALPGATVSVGDAAREAEADAAAAASGASDGKKNGGDGDDEGGAGLDDLDEDEGASPATGKDAAAKADKRRRAMRGAWRKLGSSTIAPTDTAVLFLRAACAARGWPASTAAIWPARAFLFIGLPSAADAAAVLGDNGLLSAALATVGINDWSPSRGSAALASTVRVAARADWPRAEALPTQPKAVVRLYTGAAADMSAVRESLLRQLGPRE